jgi:hypothetical protein
MTEVLNSHEFFEWEQFESVEMAAGSRMKNLRGSTTAGTATSDIWPDDVTRF